MKGALLRRVGEPLEVVDVDLAPLGDGQVRVAMAASGVCHSDLSVQQGRLPFPLPAVLGHEGAGVVEGIGRGVTRVRPGDHVVVSWIPACRQCLWCLADQPFLCERGLGDALSLPYGTVEGQTVYAGFTTATFAEEVQVLERAVVPVPADVPLEVAALVGCAVTTGVGAVVNTARVVPGETVAVLGCGGVGLSVVMGAVLAGASRVVAVDRSPGRLGLAAEMGATDTVDVSGGDDPVEAVRELTGGTGVDHAFEVVGQPETIRQAFAMARRGGTAVLVGAGGATDEVRFTAMELFMDAKRILGCVYGSADPDRDFARIVALYRAGRLPLDHLVGERIDLAGVARAFETMEEAHGARTLVTFGTL